MSIQLNLTEAQELFNETTRRFIEVELPRTKTRDWHERPDGFDPRWLAKGAELGWFSMLVPESEGGGSVSDNPLADAALVAEAFGRQVQPGPFVPMNVALAAIARYGDPSTRAAMLAGAIAGETIVGWAPTDAVAGWDLGAGVTVEPQGDWYVVTGERGPVAEAGQADLLLVAATLAGEPVQVLVPRRAAGVTVTPLATLDLARRLAQVSFDGVEVDKGSLVSSGAEGMDRALRQAVVLNAAETVGAMDELFALTVEYAKDRVAFGRPIGSFQALKHTLADEAVALEVAKAALTAAIGAVGTDADDADEVAAMAAAAIGEAGNGLAQQCLQVHGGIGYTWEHDLHLFMRRIQSNSVIYGTPSWHRERVCRFHRLGEEVAR